MNVVSLSELSNKAASGAWVNTERYGYDLPPEEQAKVVVLKSKGAWTVSIKGYNHGERLKAGFDTNGSLHACVGMEYFEAVASHQQMAAIPKDEFDRFIDVVREPVENENLLTRLLEDEEPGIWDIYTPGPYNEYLPMDRLVYRSPADIEVIRCKYPSSPTRSYSSPMKAVLEVKGPEYTIRPAEGKKFYPIHASSLLDRTNTGWPPYIEAVPENLTIDVKL